MEGESTAARSIQKRATGKEVDVLELVRMIRDKLGNVSVEVSALGPDSRRDVRDRPLTMDRVKKLLKRVEAEANLKFGKVGDDIVVVGEDFNLTVREASAPTANLIDTINLTVPSIDPTPIAAVANAARIALLRQQLLETGALDYAALAQGRGSSPDAARKWVERAEARNEIITVRYDNRVYTPLCVLDDAFDTNPAFQPVIAALAEAGETAWAAWTYLATPSTWLDGESPVDVIHKDPTAVLRATQRRISNAA